MLKETVLLMYDGYLPAKRYGGPVVSLTNLVNLCGDKYNFFVITLNHDLNNKKKFENIEDGFNQVGKAKVIYLSDEDYTYENLEKIVSDINPSIIYQNSFFGYKILKVALKISINKEIPLIIAPRGELNNNAFKIKKWKKKPYTFLLKQLLSNKKNIYFHSTSFEESISIKQKLKINNKRIYQLENIPTFNVSQLDIENEKKQGEIKIIFLSRIQIKKNLLYAIRLVNEIKNIKIKFDIYGPIENDGYWNECKTEISKAKNNVHFEYFGEVEREKIFKVFSKYDLFFFPTLSENYGHVIVESLLAGCPILISDQTPWTDINDFGGGFAINLSDKKIFKEKIYDIANMDKDEHLSFKKNANDYIKSKLSIENLQEKYNEMFNEIIK